VERAEDVEFEARLITAKKNLIWVHVIAYPVFSEGRLVGIRGSIQDITERKRAEEELRANEARFRELADQLPEVVFETDANFRLTFANRRAFDLFGYAPEDLAAGLDPLSLIVPEDRQRARDMLARRLQEQDLGIQEYTGLRKDGTTFSLLLHNRAIFRKGVPVGARGVIIDITDRKQAEEELRESEEQFRGLTEGSAHGILAINLATMRFAYANPTACRMFGYSTQEMLEMGIVDIHPKDALPHVLSEFRAKTDGGGLAADLPCLRKDGTVFYADVSGTMLSLQGQKCAVGFLVDVTERKRAEESLSSHLRMLLSSGSSRHLRCYPALGHG
jgi:PAS domain S-box-containing protein